MTKLPARMPLIAIATLILGAFGVAACGSGSTQTVTVAADTPATTATPATTTGTTSASTTAAATTQAAVYFLSEDGTTLKLAQKDVVAEGRPLRAAMVVLADGPFVSGVLPSLPSGTRVVGTDLRDGEATVNLSREFLDGYPGGGAAAETAVVAPIVFTATEIDGIRSVRITVDGQVPQPTGSQFDWTRAFTREDFPNLKIAAG